MKIIGLLLCVLLLTNCTSKTDFGPCIGAFDEKDSTKVYKINTWNLIVGIVFFELIAPPIVVLVDETFCPVANK